jgi:hypothetical protein
VRNLAEIGPRGSPPEFLFGHADVGQVFRRYPRVPGVKYPRKSSHKVL